MAEITIDIDTVRIKAIVTEIKELTAGQEISPRMHNQIAYLIDKKVPLIELQYEHRKVVAYPTKELLMLLTDIRTQFKGAPREDSE